MWIIKSIYALREKRGSGCARAAFTRKEEEEEEEEEQEEEEKEGEGEGGEEEEQCSLPSGVVEI